MSIILTNGFEVTIFQAFLPYFSKHKVHIWDVRGKRDLFVGEILSISQDEYEVTLKFVFSKKAKKIDEIFTVDLTLST